jgi:hypothetical protein
LFPWSSFPPAGCWRWRFTTAWRRSSPGCGGFSGSGSNNRRFWNASGKRRIRRAKLIRLTLLFLLLTIGMLIGCSLSLGLSVLLPKAIYVAIPLFVLGLLSMLTATIAAAMELKRALEPVELESRFIKDVLLDDAERGQQT